MAVDSASVGLALRQLGDRAHLLNFLVTQLREKVLQEPLEMDTVWRELSHQVDQVHVEVLELQKQVAELEKHLGTARKGGRGPPSRGPPSRQPPRAPDTIAPGRQGTAAGGSVWPAGPGQGTQPPHAPHAPSVERLRWRLKEAARTALRLHREKEQLLELGNRLRAELGRAAGKPPPAPLSPETQNPGEEPEAPLKRGPPLGQLQPQLPTQKQHRISTATCKSAHQKENRSPKPRQAHECHRDSGHHTQRSSSLASSSLQDTWKLLELGSSPSGLTSQDNSASGR